MAELEILAYLKKNGFTNTFRLAHELGMNRHQLLNDIRKLEANGCLMLKHGRAGFLKFPSEEKKVLATDEVALPPMKIERATSNKKRKKRKKTAILQAENVKLKEKLGELQGVIKKLEKTPPKIIQKTKTIIKKVPVTRTVVKEVIAPQKKKKRRERKVEKKAKRKIIKRLIAKTKALKFPKFKLLKRLQWPKLPKFAWVLL